MPAKKRYGNNRALDIGGSFISKAKVRFKVWAKVKSVNEDISLWLGNFKQTGHGLFFNAGTVLKEE